MGITVSGQLNFGIVFPEDFTFPWTEKFEQWDDWDFERWWREVNGFEPTFYPYDTLGEYKEGVGDKEYDEYYEEKSKWDAEHPCPIQLIDYCGDTEEMNIIAVKEPTFMCFRGSPEVIDPEKLVGDPDIVTDFCNRFEITMPHEPMWLLSSYMG